MTTINFDNNFVDYFDSDFVHYLDNNFDDNYDFNIDDKFDDIDDVDKNNEIKFVIGGLPFVKGF